MIKNLKKYLILGMILLANVSYVSAESLAPQAQSVDSVSDVQLSKPVRVPSFHSKKFERLVQKVLDVEKPSATELFGFEAAKFGGKLALFASLFGINAFWIDQKSKNASFAYALMSMQCLIIDLLFYEQDESLELLQKLQKYVASLTPEQRLSCNENYVDKLRNKLAGDNEGKGFKIGRGVVGLCDVLAPMALFIAMIALGAFCLDKGYVAGAVETAKALLLEMIWPSCKAIYAGKYKIDDLNNLAMYALPIVISVIEAGLVAKKLWHSPDHQKELILKEIEAALK